ncbi:MAG: hypothetical protein GEU91_16500 [Rhizobiales bacterium]|nr:hypothetical protein [Hyphomicrobiales bacterium]
MTTLSPTRQDLLVAIAMFAFYLGMLVWSEYIPNARGREFPVLVSGVAVVLCLLDVTSRTNTAIGRAIALALSGAVDHSARASGQAAAREAIAIGWIAAATALIVLAGFLVAIPVYVFSYMLLYAGRTVRDGAITALATTAGIWVGFELLLSYELYRGALAPN